MTTSKIPLKIQIAVLQRDKHTCQYCGATGVALEFDHVKPQVWFPAGTPSAVVHAASNLVVACQPCNGAKGKQDLVGYARMLRAQGQNAAKVTAMVARVRGAQRRKLPG